MVFEIIDDALEAIQNSLLISSGWFIDTFFNPTGVSSDLALWLVAAVLALIAIS